MTFFGKTILRREQDEGGDFDREMVSTFMEEVRTKSNLKVFTI
jgi:hypothetical protein